MCCPWNACHSGVPCCKLCVHRSPPPLVVLPLLPWFPVQGCFCLVMLIAFSHCVWVVASLGGFVWQLPFGIWRQSGGTWPWGGAGGQPVIVSIPFYFFCPFHPFLGCSSIPFHTIHCPSIIHPSITLSISGL